MPKLEEWLEKVRVKLQEKEKILLKKQASGFQSIGEIHQPNSEQGYTKIDEN